MAQPCRYPLHFMKPFLISSLALSAWLAVDASAQSAEQLSKLLKRFPQADANADGVLSVEEAIAYRDKAGKNADGEKHPEPSIAAGSYAADPDCLFDLWKAEGGKPAPLLVFIHGGGFKAGNRKAVSPAFIEKARAGGYSVMSIDYPFLDKKPIQEILPLAARSIQYARHQAKEWNIDPQRIAVLGGSAGAGTSLWIAATPDLADPASADPVARESSRVAAAASINGQATYDLLKWEELVGPAPEGVVKDEAEPLRFYHLAPGTDLRTDEKAKAARAKVDIHGLLAEDTPPLYLFTSGPKPKANDRGAYVHSPRHSEAVAARAKELGIVNELVVREDAAGKDGAIEAIAFFKKQFEAVKEPAKKKGGGKAEKASALYQPTATPVYKTAGDVELKLHVFNPQGHQPSAKTPAVVFFFGGGFTSGSPAQFYPQSAYLASRGIVAISADYRTKSKNGTNPDTCVADAKSAIRWVRSHAAELGIDPQRIAAGGGSAGGFLAAATATLPGYNEAGEDTSVSAKPDALILYNGLFDLGPSTNSHARIKAMVGDAWTDFSPIHHIAAPFPPTTSFLGKEDKLIPVAEAEKAKAEVLKAGGHFDLHLYEGQGHGFFNFSRGDGGYYKITLAETDRFLTSLGWLSGEPTVAD